MPPLRPPPQAALSQRWMSLDAGVRAQIKQLMLATLGAQVWGERGGRVLGWRA